MKKEENMIASRRKVYCSARANQTNLPSSFALSLHKPRTSAHMQPHVRTHLWGCLAWSIERERERGGGGRCWRQTINGGKWNLFSVSPHPPQCDPSVPFRCSRLFAMQPGQQWCFWKAAAKDAVAEGRRQRVTDVDSCKKWGDDSSIFILFSAVNLSIIILLLLLHWVLLLDETQSWVLQQWICSEQLPAPN